MSVPRTDLPALQVSKDELEALFKCACLLQGNWPKCPKPNMVDAIYVPGLAADNWQGDDEDDGILETAVYLQRNEGITYIAIPGYEGTFPHGPDGPKAPMGYPGGCVWKQHLLNLGVPPERVVFYAHGRASADGKSWNTRTEAEEFLRLAQERAWTRVVVLATPFHLLRVLLTVVKILNETHVTPKLFPVTPRSVSWTKWVHHSQGELQLRRFMHIDEEWDRVPRYKAQGSLCSFHELAEYLIASLELT